MSLLFDCSNFPPGYNLASAMRPYLTRAQFLRALIAVGYPSRRKAYSKVGIWRAKLLKNMVFGYLNTDLSVTDYFLNLEASEKATVSFLFGQAMTHSFALQYLEMFYLVHVNGCHESYEPALLNALPKHGAGPLKERGRPDFIGRSASGYHIFETKGRSAGDTKPQFPEKVIEGALAQVSKISKVNGSDPITRVAACFKFSQGGVYGDIRDPPSEGYAYDLVFNEAMALKKYYSFFLDQEAELKERRIDGHKFMVARIDDDVSCGVDKDIISGVKHLMDMTGESKGVFNSLLKDIIGISRSRVNEISAPDGVAIIPEKARILE